MLGQPVSMLIPEVVGFKLTGALPEGVTATDLVLTVTQMLRKKGVVGRFVEFYGPGLGELPLADRATIANMAPEYGATCGFFPVDDKTLDYLRLTGRDRARSRWSRPMPRRRACGATPGRADPVFTDTLELDLATVEPSLAGPKRPQDRVALKAAKRSFEDALASLAGDIAKDAKRAGGGQGPRPRRWRRGDRRDHQLHQHRRTRRAGRRRPGRAEGGGERPDAPSPGSRPRSRRARRSSPTISAKAGLQRPLDALGFNLVGYGCTTCIGNSGPLAETDRRGDQRRQPRRRRGALGQPQLRRPRHAHVRANYLASPPLVVAYALTGTVLERHHHRAARHRQRRQARVPEGHLADATRRSPRRSRKAVDRRDVPDALRRRLQGRRALAGDRAPTAQPDLQLARRQHLCRSNPPYFEGMRKDPATSVPDINGARMLAILGDSITTDHISPGRHHQADSPAGDVPDGAAGRQAGLQSYGARRGNHEVMMRGTFANIRIKNEMVPGVEGGMTSYADRRARCRSTTRR